MRTTVVSLAVVLCAAANAQVKPVEPFGGRPFGAGPDSVAAPIDPAAPGVQGTAGNAQTPAPTIVMQPGSTAVLGNAPPPAPPAPAPAPAPVPSPPPQATGAAPAPQQQPQQAQQPVQQQATGTPPPAGSGAAASGAMNPPFAATPRAGGQAPALPTGSAAGQSSSVRGLPGDAPRIVVSGGTYSADASHRLLIVNGQVVREGADLGGGVVLEQVTPDGAVLGFKGSRYNVLF